MKLTVRWLKNHNVKVTTHPAKGRSVSRVEGPEGSLSQLEAALALGTYRELIGRMVRSGRIKASPAPGKVFVVRRIPMAEVLRLRRAWKVTRKPTTLVRTAS